MPEIQLPSADQMQQLINVWNSDKLIMGVYWDKSSGTQLTRTDASVGLISNVGVDGELVKNDFDRMPIFSEMHEVEDEYGNKFIRIPKFYIQKTGGKNHLIKRVSKTRYPGFYLPWIFWDFTNNKELDYYDHGKYKGSLSGEATNKLESKFGEQPSVNDNIVNFRTYAENNNDATAGLTGYQQLDIHAQDVLETLFHVEFATLNSQSIMMGFVSGQYSSSHTVTVAENGANRVVVANSTADGFRIGQSMSVGTSTGNESVSVTAREIIDIAVYDTDNKSIEFDGDPIDVAIGDVVANRGYKSGFSADIAASSGSIGDNTSGKYPCMYRGIESPWGDLWQFVDGVNINDNQTWNAKEANYYASNVFPSPYEQLKYVNSASNGYVSEMGLDNNLPFANFATSVNGGTSTYYTDYYYQSSGQIIALVGGLLAYGSNAGLSYWNLNNSSSAAAWNICGQTLIRFLNYIALYNPQPLLKIRHKEQGVVALPKHLEANKKGNHH